MRVLRAPIIRPRQRFRPVGELDVGDPAAPFGTVPTRRAGPRVTESPSRTGGAPEPSPRQPRETIMRLAPPFYGDLMAKLFERFTLHVQLDHIAPPIWRRVEVEGTETLRKLHHILQAAFGWEDAHLHDFEVDGMTYAMLDVDDMRDFADPHPTGDERKVRLHKLLKPGSRLRYRYDFGDGWEHTILVEKMETIESAPWGAARIVDGARACPPEDVGGPPGYDALLSALHHDPQSAEAAQYRDWLGPGFDAERFDLRAANATLHRMAANGWGKR